MFHALTKVNQVHIVLDLIRQKANHNHNVANPERQIANAEVDAKEDCIYIPSLPLLWHTSTASLLYTSIEARLWRASLLRCAVDGVLAKAL